MDDLYLGLDIGASNLKFGVVDGAGKILDKGSEKIEADTLQDLKDQCNSIYEEFSRKENERKIRAIGVGVPGFINSRSGVLSQSPNIPALDGKNIHRAFIDTFPVKTIVENDANAAAWGEYWTRAEKPELLLFLTLGTGVGGGIVWRGDLWRGVAGYGAEIGHAVIKPGGRLCGCGSKGCLEAEFSIVALKAKVKDALQQGEESSLADIKSEITGRQILDAALAEDKLAANLIRAGGRMLGLALGNLINIFNPDSIVLGGGITVVGELLMREVTLAANSSAITPAMEYCNIEISTLGNEAGIIGAAGLAKRSLEKQ